MSSCYPFILTYLLTPWSRVLLEKLTGFAANQEIPFISELILFRKKDTKPVSWQ